MRLIAITLKVVGNLIVSAFVGAMTGVITALFTGALEAKDAAIFNTPIEIQTSRMLLAFISTGLIVTTLCFRQVTRKYLW